MKKSVLKKLKALAAEMPPKLEKAVTVCMGSELIEKGQKTQPDGTPINPKARYKLTGSKLVNHEEKLKQAFTKGGIAAVMEYCNTIMPKPIVYEQIQQNLKEQRDGLIAETKENLLTISETGEDAGAN